MRGEASGRRIGEVARTYPNNPDRHAAFHVALSLSHCTYGGLAAVTRGRRRHLEGLVRYIDILKDKIGSKNEHEKAHSYYKRSKGWERLHSPRSLKLRNEYGGGSGAGG